MTTGTGRGPGARVPDDRVPDDRVPDDRGPRDRGRRDRAARDAGRAAAASAMARWRRRDRVRLWSAVAVAGIGVVSVLSALSRPLRVRLDLLLEVLPFVAPRVAATTLALISCALLLLARGLRRGQLLAWVGAVALLSASVVLHLVKGLDVEEAALALAGLIWLAPRRDCFPVLPARLALRRAVLLGVGGAFGSIVLGTAVALLLGHRQHLLVGSATRGVTERLGGDRLSPLPGAGPLVTPVVIALGIGVVTATLWVLLSPRPGRHLDGAAHVAAREHARQVVARYSDGTLDWFALRDDKDWFFAGHSVVAHSVRRGVCLVSPDPVGPQDERAEIWAEFMGYAERGGWSVAVIGARPSWLEIYAASGLRALYLGDEAVVDCAGFTLDGHARKGLRGAVSRVRRAGFTTELVDPLDLTADQQAGLLELAAQTRRGDGERGYSMTLSRLFDSHDTGLLLTVVRDTDGAAQAFLQWVPAPGIGGWSLDLMRRSAAEGLPNGLLDAAVVATIAHVAPTGGALSLNFAVLREVLEREPRGAAEWLSRAAARGLSGRAQMESLSRFNAKYDPTWQPRYAVLDSAEFVATQGFVMADAEGITELPVVGRFLGSARGTTSRPAPRPTPHASTSERVRRSSSI